MKWDQSKLLDYLKMDFLGLTNLSVLNYCIELINDTTGKLIDIYKIPINDTKTFDLLSKGDTFGVFQLEICWDAKNISKI